MDEILLGNSLMDWLYAGSIALGLVAIAALIKWLAVHRLTAIARSTSGRLDDALVEALRGTRLRLLFVPALYIGCGSLELPPWLGALLGAAAAIAVLIQAGLWVSQLLKFWIFSSQQPATEPGAADSTGLSVLLFVGRTAVWATVALLALDNVGVDVTALIAGLGIGGIAVALAAQNILGDLFASLSIVLDKPFAVGDFIVIDDVKGSVEHVGLKTTRLRSVDGEQIVIANSDMLKSRVRNYKRMQERRAVFQFGVLYETLPEKLARIPELVREVIAALDKARFGRAHFKELGESAHVFEVVYWMLDPDYDVYMDVQQSINLGLVRAFAREGIGFAYPTRTLYFAGPAAAEQAG